MNEEEALEIFKNLILLPYDWKITDKYKGTINFIGAIEGNKAIQIISNLINKLQKENEELNEKILDNAGIYQLGFKDGEKSYIKKVKDKIRKNEEIIDISNDGDLIHELLQKNKVYEELLESEE